MALVLAVGAGCSAADPAGSRDTPGNGTTPGGGAVAGGVTPGTTGGEAGPFFTGALEDQTASVRVAGSEGDLWPSCWSDDDELYAANGDGRAFDVATNPTVNAYDVAVSRVHGTPESGLSGTTRAFSAAVASVWTPGPYNRKPTGILCRNGDLYLAVQDLKTGTFDDAPAASISVSHDKGLTWSWDHGAPMFGDHVFTTIFFLDFGKDAAQAIDGYVYAYGMDQNWASQSKLYLARVAADRVMDRAAWTFFAGLASDGTPIFDPDLAARTPVLEDDRRLYGDLTVQGYDAGGVNMQPVAQGSVVYDAPLKRYLYSSWTEQTQEFYEAPSPWGPWTLFYEGDFGLYPWLPGKYGGYAATLPSKFIAADGRSMWVQSNCWGQAHGCDEYQLAFRRLAVTPSAASPPSNGKSPAPLSAPQAGATPLLRAVHFGAIGVLADGDLAHGDDSWTGDRAATDFWGYTWPSPVNVNTLVYVSGQAFSDGGWFADLKVQVRQRGVWVDVQGLLASPAYPFDAGANPFRTFTFTFADSWGDGVRLVGTPGGTARFTSVAELGVYYR